MGWEKVIRHRGEGERILFKVGLMSFKATSAETDGQFAFIETILPPGADVEPHQHPEAEVFYVVDGEFVFWIGNEPEPVLCGKGAFVSVPPHVRHAYANHTDHAGTMLGMLAPGGDGGLETFFRQVGIPVADDGAVPDLDRHVSHLRSVIAELRSRRD